MKYLRSYKQASRTSSLKAYPIHGEWIGNQYGEWNSDINSQKRKAYQEGYEQAEKDLGWHSVKESLPPIDEEVIVLTDDIHGKIVSGSHMICYAHRPNPKGWDGKNIETGEIKHYDVVTYDGWNIPGVTHWMYLPKLEEEL